MHLATLTAWDVLTLSMVATLAGVVVVLYRLWRRGRDCVICKADWERKAHEWDQERRGLASRIADLEGQVDMLLKKLSIAMSKIAQLEGGPAPPKPLLSVRPQLLVAVGPDAALQVDLAALREVATATGLHYTRLLPVTLGNLKAALARRREDGCPIPYVHLAVHAGPNGLQFLDGTASGVELSEVLAGVKVLLIAGCSADQVGDLLGVVPTVVTLREAITHEDARALTRVFWQAVGEGLTGEQAYGRVLERCPAVAEFAELN